MSLKQWVTQQMEMLMGFSDEGLVKSVLDQPDEPNMRKYCSEIFGDDKKLIDEIIKRRNFRKPKNQQRNQKVSIKVQAPQKAEPIEKPVQKTSQVQSAAQLASDLFGTTYSNAPQIHDKRKGKPKSRRRGKPTTPEPGEGISDSKKANENLPKEDDNFQMPEAYKPKARAKKDKRKKFRTLDEVDDGGYMMPGRHKCDCQAQKHELINNCLNCGRIVCEQEGEGSCLFCGEDVIYPETIHDLDDNLRKALQQKDRLIDYDRHGSKRTEIVDDETDYYRGVDEEKIREARFGSRLEKKFGLNLDTGEMEEQTMDEFIEEHAVEEIVVEKKNRKDLLLFNEDLGNNNLSYKFKEKVKNGAKEKKAVCSRIQDSRLMEMYDSGTCLTMHQPWASLLVKGIKIHEGRVWPSNHRGRLWIHSSSRHPDEETLETVLADHPGHSVGDLEYPVSALLGFVTVDDVLCKEDYKETYPDGPSGSPFVFICSDPVELEIKLQASGNHKLWRLSKELLKSARAQLGL